MVRHRLAVVHQDDDQLQVAVGLKATELLAQGIRELSGLRQAPLEAYTVSFQPISRSCHHLQGSFEMALSLLKKEDGQETLVIGVEALVRPVDELCVREIHAF